MKRNVNWTFISLIIAAALFLLIGGYSAFSLSEISEDYGDKAMKAMEDSIRKAAIQCYALEGSYPPNVDYLAEHYGILLNKREYYYFYEVIASNIMPDITVIKIGKGADSKVKTGVGGASYGG